MDRLTNLISVNATDLLFGLATFLAIYLAARLMKASAIVSLSFAVLPLAIAYFALNPHVSNGVMALLR